LVSKALCVDFDVLSASEASSDFRQFFLANNEEGTFSHVYERVEDQLDNQPCLLHPNSKRCDATCGEMVDFMLAGSPCDPYSRQRCKRFESGSVKTHCDFETTFTSVIKMFKKYCPKIGILEQVQGFQLPLDTTTRVTPYEMLPACSSMHQNDMSYFGLYAHTKTVLDHFLVL
jgi:site-specific DNA-cytosine methylase